MADNGMNFEDALKRLEEIVKKLETGEASLDESLALYEEGTGMIRVCTAKLDEAEERVRLLTVSQNGEYHEQPFQAAE